MHLQTLSGPTAENVSAAALERTIADYRQQPRGGIVIKEVQRFTAQNGFPVVVDGIWGPKSEAAFRATWAKLYWGGRGGQGGGGRVITAEVVGKDTGKDGIRVGGSWKDFFQSSIAAGLTYLKRADAEKKQREAAAAGVDTTVIQNADGTFSVQPAGMDWKKVAMYAAIAGVAVLVIMQFSGSRRGSRSRR